MGQHGEITAEADSSGLRTGTYLISIEICFRFTRDSQQVRQLMGVCGRILRRKQIAVQGKFAEERPMLPVTPTMEINGVNSMVFTRGD